MRLSLLILLALEGGYAFTGQRFGRRISVRHRVLSPAVIDLLSSAAEPDLESLVLENFDTLSPSDMKIVSEKFGSEGPGRWQVISSVIEDETRRRMSRAKLVLEDLLSAGEINELDRRIVSCTFKHLHG